MPTDEQLVATAQEVLQLLHGAFGAHPGYRAGKCTEGS
jgi:hypothetical protein